MALSRNGTLNKIVVLVLVGGFAMLVADIRSEHVDVLKHNWRGWIPIAYSSLMIVAGLVGLARWNKGGRQALLIAFCLAFVVGGLGFWFHTRGHPVLAVTHVLDAWIVPMRREDAPPALAPLSFAGLGLLGTLVCLRRFQT